MPYPVQNLVEGRGEPTTVRPGDSAQKALALMIEHDFSQLPVIDEAKWPLGMVTHESILRALSNFGVKLEDLRVSNALVKAQTYRPEDDLFDLLDRLKETNAVLIVDGEDKLIGIVTSYDSMEYFRRRAEDMMLVEDIESMVKDLVQTAFIDETGEVDQERLAAAIEEVTSSQRALMRRYRNALRLYLELQGQQQPEVDRQCLETSFSHLAQKEKPKQLDDLTLYEHTELLLHKGRWDPYRLIFDLEPEALRTLLSGVRETRNALAHFRAEISPIQRSQLKFCTEWLAQHPVEQFRETGAAYETSPETDTPIVPTEEVLGPDDSRYAPLAIWLQSRPSNADRVQLAFVEVEEIIGGLLPASAHTHRAWWANDSVGHVQSQQWLDVGWRVAQINMTEEKVTFARIREREAAYIGFFSALQTDVRETTGFPLRELSPDGQSWQTAASFPEKGPKYLHFVFAFGRGKRFRIELYIDTTDKEKTKSIFDRLYAARDRFHATLGEELSWDRLSEKRASRIALYRPGTINAKLRRMVHLNRMNYLEEFQRLIDEYNAGSRNVEEFFDELVKFAQQLNEEEQRAVAENLTEEELAVFDVLTRPGPDLTEKEKLDIKGIARELLDTLKRENLVLDWRKRQQFRAAVRIFIEEMIWQLPERYSDKMCQQKSSQIYQHIYDNYWGAERSICARAA